MTGPTSHPDAARAQSARLPDPGARIAAPAAPAPESRPAGDAPAFRIEAPDADDRVHGRAALAALARAGDPPAARRDLGEVDLDRWERGRRDEAPEIELGLADFIDVINPLHHIPVISSIYRTLTGDEISGPARVAGGALFGGPAGFVSGIANAIVAEVNGGDVGETALAVLLNGGEAPVGEPAGTTAVAALDGALDGALEGAPAAAPLGFAAMPDPIQELDTAPGPAAAPEAPALGGAAALDALARDLRGLAAFAAPVEAVVAAPVAARAAARATAPGGIPTSGLAPKPVAVSAERPPAAAQPREAAARETTAPPDFSARMLDALDKYRTLMRARAPDGEAAGGAFDGTY